MDQNGKIPLDDQITLQKQCVFILDYFILPKSIIIFIIGPTLKVASLGDQFPSK